MSMTLKVYIIIHHYLHYFKTSGKNFRLTNGEFNESCHSTLRQSEEMHNFKVKRKLGTPMHQQKIWLSVVLFNFKRAGHMTPLRLRKMSSLQSPSSPSTPSSKRFLEKYPIAAKNHKILSQQYR